MDIRRKLMTDGQIAQTQRRLMDEVTEVRDEYSGKFASIGYELALEFTSKTENDDDYSVISEDDEMKFPCGYVSRATITVKRPKTAGDIKAEEAVAEEYVQEAEALGADISDDESEAVSEEKQQELDDEALRASEDELSRSVAFTHVMLIRIYRSFWVDTISICDGMEQLRADLDEFCEQLTKDEMQK